MSKENVDRTGVLNQYENGVTYDNGYKIVRKHSLLISQVTFLRIELLKNKKKSMGSGTQPNKRYVEVTARPIPPKLPQKSPCT